jgi:hypothetical protein
VLQLVAGSDAEALGAAGAHQHQAGLRLLEVVDGGERADLRERFLPPGCRTSLPWVSETTPNGAPALRHLAIMSR